MRFGGAAGARARGVGRRQEAAADAVHEVRDVPQAAAEEGLPAQQGPALRGQPRRVGRGPAAQRGPA